MQKDITNKILRTSGKRYRNKAQNLSLIDIDTKQSPNNWQTVNLSFWRQWTITNHTQFWIVNIKLASVTTSAIFLKQLLNSVCIYQNISSVQKRKCKVDAQLNHRCNNKKRNKNCHCDIGFSKTIENAVQESPWRRTTLLQNCHPKWSAKKMR